MSSPTANSPVVLVTGATDGIGRETALELVRRGATVIVHGRNPQRIEETRAALARVGRGAVAEPVRADLASLAEVRAMADELGRRGIAIDVLLNNAGVYVKKAETSVDGFELTMAVNHLAPFLLTHLLLANDAGRGLSRVINVSSVAHHRGKIDAESFERVPRRYDEYGAYADSKLANVLFSVELARRLGAKPTVNALHPGVVSTKLLTEGFEMRGPDSLAQGAAMSVKLALASEVAGVSGKYFAQGREAPMSAAAQDRALARRFYERSAELVGVEPIGG